MKPSHAFDRKNSDSVFLNHVAKEFHKRGTPRRLELSKKENSHPFVASLGMRVPQPISRLDDITALPALELPTRFVLKFARGWSARGVMLLEQMDGEGYFDHMSLRALTIEEIVSTQRKVAASFGTPDPSWLIEEMISSTLDTGAVPFDYKFYCFNGAIGLIGQFDRNTNPPKMALFDGNFHPLKHGMDYIRGNQKAQPGVPLVPLHAPEMMWWAQRLSRDADSPFVSVDLYDSPDGPVFGEYTYSPGGTYKRMFIFSHPMIDRFDALFEGRADVSPLARSSLAQRKRIIAPDDRHYRALAGYAYNGGPRGADRLASFHAANGHDAPHPLEDDMHDWSSLLCRNWEEVRRQLSEQIELHSSHIAATEPG